jgi:hypothetical protein
MIDRIFSSEDSSANKIRLLSRFSFFLILLMMFSGLLKTTPAQVTDLGRQLEFSQQFRMADRIIRIAEPGQIADTVNVWGDVNSPGRYLVPKGTALPELISYSFGPTGFRDRETALNWSRLRIEINIADYDPENGKEIVQNFRYRYHEPLPEGMRSCTSNKNNVI